VVEGHVDRVLVAGAQQPVDRLGEAALPEGVLDAAGRGGEARGQAGDLLGVAVEGAPAGEAASFHGGNL
jgi:hypothetical protein